jgi:predicted Zn finger-like uncharacterized protein
MKITCQACAAKYTIADEKVLGKVVKIRCKKCGATIVINGNDPSAGATVGDPQSFDYAGGGSADAWMVNVAEGDQRTMADDEVVSAYRAGIVNDETFCWKDGMPDWLPLRDVAQLYAACSGGHSTGVGPIGPTGPTGPTDPPGVDVATKVQDPPAFLHPSSRPVPAPDALAAHGGGNGSGAVYAPGTPAAAARRAPGRAPAADLFGGAAQAGGEDDVMTSAPAKMPALHDDAARDKLTGARNENSVLFSLNALTSKGGVMQQPAVASAEASGLIDIRQLSAQIGIGDDKKQSRIDDIMNLAGGGAFSPSLSAPVLSAPPIEEYTPQASMGPAQPAKGKGLIFLALGAAAFVVVAAVGGALMFMRRGSEETADSKDKPAASTSTAADNPAASAAPADSVAKNDTPQPSASESASGSPAPTHSPAAAAPKDATPKAAAGSTPKESAPKESSGGLPAALAAAAGASDQPFNMGEAKARLAAIAASVQSCKKGDATGTGRVVVVFNPNGGTQSASISGPPFEGTPTGACVAVKFRGARVPPFGGSPFSVAKSFTIN